MTEHTAAPPNEAHGASCSLAPGALEDRIGAWRSLAAQALTRQFAEGRVRTAFLNSPNIAQRLAELIDAEKECCSFLDFHVHERGDVLEVELHYPPEFAPMLASARQQDPR